MSAQKSSLTPNSLTVGIDVGGTFTDLLAIDAATGAVKLAKVATTPDNQALGFMASLAAAGADPKTLQAVVHGTTTTTNALLERKIAKVGLITTKGFRDVLEIRTLRMPKLYDIGWTKPEPLVERYLRPRSTRPPSPRRRSSSWRWAARPWSSISCTATSTRRTSAAPPRSCAGCGPMPT